MLKAASRQANADGSLLQIQALKNLSAVLEAAGSSLKKVVKVNVFITTMKDFTAMNEGYIQVIEKPLPVSTREAPSVSN